MRVFEDKVEEGSAKEHMVLLIKNNVQLSVEGIKSTLLIDGYKWP